MKLAQATCGVLLCMSPATFESDSTLSTSKINAAQVEEDGAGVLPGGEPHVCSEF
jgi:hypothetical protein